MLRRKASEHRRAIAISATLSLACVTACGDDTDDSDTNPDVLDSDAGSDAAPDTEDVAPTDTTDADASDGDAGDVRDDTGPVAPSVVWPEPVSFELAPAFDELAESIGPISGWATHITADARPHVGLLGGFGTGNGHAFALFGYGNPLNSMHTLAAPTYEKQDGFFGDYALEIAVDGAVVPFDEEWTARSLVNPAVLNRARAGDLVLDTIDFAPWTEGDERFCMVRIAAITNTGDAAVDSAALHVRGFGTALAEGDQLVERRDTRTLTTGTNSPATASDRLIVIAADTLGAGESEQHAVLHCAAFGEDAPALPGGDPADWLAETADAYAAWEAHLTDYELPDPMLRDFVEGMKLTLITQTASTGATSPMSQYTRTWARDNIGPVLAWHAFGGFEEARGTMDYIYGAVVTSGDFSNSYAVDMDLSELPDPPDWDAMPPLSGRVAAETPSYMVWIYGEHARVTGDVALADERWGFLRRALTAQGFDDDLLLPFTEDETFRAAMNSVFGLALEYPHAIRHTSANSSFLWLGAARQYAWLADENERFDEATAIREFAEDVAEAATSTYLLEDGCFAAYMERDGGAVSPPFEDVSLKVVWAGWLDGDDPVAAESIACLVDRIGMEPGLLRSPVHPTYVNIPAVGGGEGVLTGMLPGYNLAALTRVGHPDAEAALSVMGRFTSTSGNFQEYIDANTEGGLQLIYDTSGVQGDYSSKYRPWEGGINLHAVVDYLFGIRPDAVARRLLIRPHLPDGWPEMAARDARLGDERFDVVVRRDGDAVQVQVTSLGAAPVDVVLRWDDEQAATVAVDGADAPAVTTRTHFGATSVETEPVQLAGGATVAFRIE